MYTRRSALDKNLISDVISSQVSQILLSLPYKATRYAAVKKSTRYTMFSLYSVRAVAPYLFMKFLILVVP
jgi:hypothetical protein